MFAIIAHVRLCLWIELARSQRLALAILVTHYFLQHVLHDFMLELPTGVRFVVRLLSQVVLKWFLSSW